MTRSRHSRRTSAAERGVALHPWEHGVLDALIARDGASLEGADFHAALTDILSAATIDEQRFDLTASQRSARQRADQAARRVRQAPPADRHRTTDRQLEWLLLSDESAAVLNDDYLPAWLSNVAARGGPTGPMTESFPQWLTSLAKCLDGCIGNSPSRVSAADGL